MTCCSSDMISCVLFLLFSHLPEPLTGLRFLSVARSLMFESAIFPIFCGLFRSPYYCDALRHTAALQHAASFCGVSWVSEASATQHGSVYRWIILFMLDRWMFLYKRHLYTGLDARAVNAPGAVLGYLAGHKMLSFNTSSSEIITVFPDS